MSKSTRITVGSLVLHTLSGHVGLVVDHFMWNAQYGGFRIEFLKPWVREIGHPLTEIQCPHYDVELIS